MEKPYNSRLVRVRFPEREVSERPIGGERRPARASPPPWSLAGAYRGGPKRLAKDPPHDRPGFRVEIEFDATGRRREVDLRLPDSGVLAECLQESPRVFTPGRMKQSGVEQPAQPRPSVQLYLQARVIPFARLLDSGLGRVGHFGWIRCHACVPW